MSLELAIQENTNALRDLIARLSTTSATAINMTGAEYVAKIDATVTDKVEAKKPATTQTAPETKAATTAPAAESPSEPVAAIDYTKDVKPLLLKVSTSKGRDALVALLTKFGVAKGDQLPADKLGNVIAEVEILLAA